MLNRDNMESIVLDIIDKYAVYEEADIFTAIFSKIEYFTKTVIEIEHSLKSNLERILDNFPLKTELLAPSNIIRSVERYNLFDLFVEHLIFRHRRSELFGHLDYMTWHYLNFNNIEDIILDEFWVLENPFMHGQDFFFKGVLWDDFLRNPISFGLANDQILLEGTDRKKAYANLSSDDHLVVKGLTQIEGEKWYLRGKLVFDRRHKRNTINVVKVISDKLSQPRY